MAYNFFRSAYYRFLFGRRFPLADLVSTAIHTWEKHWRSGDFPISQEIWDSQYSNGHWEFIKDLHELPRYSIIAGYFLYFKSGKSLLDVGCGEGTLQARLGQENYSKYVGIDVSEAAIEKASSRNDGRTVFLCENALDYQPGELFDAIVFNETLYYFNDPLAVVEKYKRNLKDDGIIITSMFLNSHRAAYIWRKLKTAYSSVDDVKITNNAKTWICNVFSVSN